jgi:hypothetical protein
LRYAALQSCMRRKDCTLMMDRRMRMKRNLNKRLRSALCRKQRVRNCFRTRWRVMNIRTMLCISAESYIHVLNYYSPNKIIYWWRKTYQSPALTEFSAAF